jgi:hypothetical protein
VRFAAVVLCARLCHGFLYIKSQTS